MEQTSNENKALLWSALLAALRITESEVTTVERERLQWAARELWKVRATPDEVEGRALRMRRAYSVPLSAKLLVSHWAEFAAPSMRDVPVRVRHRGADCCRWCEPGLAER